MKVSVSIPDSDLDYLDRQVAAGLYPTRSAAIHAAVRSLRTRDLEAQYADAARDWRDSGDEAAWEVTIADGLDDPSR